MAWLFLGAVLGVAVTITISAAIATVQRLRARVDAQTPASPLGDSSPASASTPSGPPTSSGFLNQPNPMELRVVERDGKRWLQQWRHPPSGELWKYEWVEVTELSWPPSNVRKLRSPAIGRG